MKGFKDSFIEKHGFWPATQHELLSDVLSRLCNEVAEFVDSATGRGDYAEIEPVPLIGKPVKLLYRNYRGEVSNRTITPLKPWYGSTEWHPEPQWLLKAFDHEKDAERDFALADFGTHTPAINLELIRIVSENPVPSHGGPAAGVAWELRLNGVLIESSYDRYDWFDRDKKGLKPPSTLTRIRDELANALNVSAVAE